MYVCALNIFQEYIGHFREWGLPSLSVKTLCPIDPDTIEKKPLKVEEDDDSNKEGDERKRRRNNSGPRARPRGEQGLVPPSVAHAVHINGRKVLLCNFNGIIFQVRALDLAPPPPPSLSLSLSLSLSHTHTHTHTHIHSPFLLTPTSSSHQIPVDSDDSDNNHGDGQSSDEDRQDSDLEAAADNDVEPSAENEGGTNGLSKQKERLEEDDDLEREHSDVEDDGQEMDQSESSGNDLADSVEENESDHPKSL